MVAFVRVTVDRERDTYASSIWVVPADGGAPRAMTSGRRDSTPRWSPDGRRLGFLRVAEAEGRPPTAQVFALSLDGGEPRALTSMPEGVTAFAWAPDGQQLVVGGNVRGAVNPMPEPGRPRPSDARVVSRAHFRADGSGFLDAGRRSRLFFVTLRDETGRPGPSRPIGQGRLGDQGAVWSHDGTRVYFTAETCGRARVRPAAGGVDGGAGRRRAAQRGGSRRWRDLAAGAQSRRHARGLHRRAQRTAGAVLQPGGPVRRGSRLGTDLQPHRALRLRHRGGPRPATSARRVAASATSPVWTGDGAALITVGGGGGPREPGADRCGDRQPSARSPTATTKSRDSRRPATDRSRWCRRRRRESPTCKSARLRRVPAAFQVIANPNDAMIGGARPARARDVLDAVVRRHADPGMDPQAARVRPVERVPGDPADSRRAPRRLRRDVHARVPVDGRPRLRRAVHEPARQHDLRAGVRQQSSSTAIPATTTAT